MVSVQTAAAAEPTLAQQVQDTVLQESSQVKLASSNCLHMPSSATDSTSSFALTEQQQVTGIAVKIKNTTIFFLSGTCTKG